MGMFNGYSRSDFPISGFAVSGAYGARLDVTLDASAGPDNGEGAVQSFKDECDINNIMAKFQRTGMLEWINTHEGTYGDVTGASFEASMATILKAQEMFDE